MVFYKRTVDLAYDSINDTPNIEADAKEESLKKKAKLNPLTTNVALLHKNTVEIEKLERKLGELNRELYHLEFRTHNVCKLDKYNGLKLIQKDNDISDIRNYELCKKRVPDSFGCLWYIAAWQLRLLQPMRTIINTMLSIGYVASR